MNRASQSAVKGLSALDRALQSNRKFFGKSATLIESASGKIRRANEKAEKSQKRLNRTARETRGAFGAAAAGVGLLSPRLARLSLVVTQLVSIFGQMKTGLGSISAAAGGAAVGIGTMAASIIGIVGAITAAVAALSILTLGMIALKAAVSGLRKGFAFLKDAINLGAQARATAKSFEVLLGSAEGADKLIKSLKELANQTPITTQEIISAGQGLVGFGFAAGNVVDTLSRLSDIASGISGLNLKELSDLFGKIFTGAFTAVDVKQLGGRGIPILDALAKSLGLVDDASGKATEQVLKLVTAGKIGFPEVAAAFRAMTDEGGKFFGLNISLSKEFIGLTSTMSSKWVEFKTLLGEPLSDALRPLLTQGIGILDQLMESATALQPRVRAEADKWVAIAQTAFKSPEGWAQAVTSVSTVIEAILGASMVTLAAIFREAMFAVINEMGQVFQESFGGKNIGEKLLILTGLKGAFEGAKGTGKFLLGIQPDPTGDTPGAAFERGKLGLPEPPSKILETALEALKGIQLELESIAKAENDAAMIVAQGEVGNRFDVMIGDLSRTLEADRRQTAAQADTAAAARIAQREFNALPAAALMRASGDVPGGTAIRSLADLEASRTKIATAGALAAEEDRLRGLGIEPSEMAGLRTQADAAKKSIRTMADGLGDLDKMLAAGLLNQGEFDRARVKIEASFTKRATAVGGRGGISEAEKLQQRGAQIALAGRNPAEIFRDTKAELDILRAAGALTFDEFNRAVGIAEERHGSAMASMADAQRRMVEASKSELQKLMDQWGNMALQIDRANVNIAQSISANLTNSIADWATGAKSAGEAFRAMATGIVNDITRIVTQMAVQLALSRALGFTFGGGGGFFAAGVRHDGSSSGESRTRMVSPAVFAGARRFHAGGTVPGLRRDEEPGILQTGETVLSREDSIKARTKLATDQSGEAKEPGRATEITIVNVDDVNRIREMISTNPDIILNGINKNLPTIKRMIRG